MPNRKATTFNEYCKIALNEFNLKFIKTLTVDGGKEFSRYSNLEFVLKVDVHFADPYIFWKRGTNENTNALIREFSPKKFDFYTITQKEVDIVEGYLNNRPRKCLGYKASL